LVFMAGLAVANPPDRKRVFHCGELVTVGSGMARQRMNAASLPSGLDESIWGC
jgi:hypothetical protein